jgi:hypothetical protein
MLKNVLRLVFIGVFVVGIVGIWEFLRASKVVSGWFGGNTATTHAVVLQQIQTLGKLELVRYNFKDIIEHEQMREWLPNPQTVLVVQGMAVGCIDLTKISLSDITSETETIVVHLPNPEICSYQIDHSKSKVYSTSFAFMEEAQLIDQAYQKAEAQIQKSAIEMGILTQTQQNAEKILKPLLEKITNKKVALRYRLHATLPPKR